MREVENSMNDIAQSASQQAKISGDASVYVAQMGEKIEQTSREVDELKMNAEAMRDQVRQVKKLTDKPFGVNIMLMSPYADEVAKVIVEEGVPVVTTGAGDPEKYMKMWKEEYGGKIINQLKKLGASADWDRERFTMDEGCSKAVQEVFIRLYEKGYIYKGSRIINWCPVCQTSISDAEVEHEDQDGFFWHINYPIAGEEGRFVEIATTRPETLLLSL